MQPIQQRKVGSLFILQVQGSPIERARAIGELVKKGELSRASLDHFSRLIDDYHRLMPPWSRLIAKSLYWLWRRSRYIFRRDALWDELKTFCEAAGFPLSLMIKGMVLPDVLASTVGALGVVDRTFLSFGCSSVGGRFVDGAFVTGRNLDFTGAGVWDAAPLLVAIIPKSDESSATKRELRHLVISSEPLFFGSITGINECGIQVSIHQNFSRDILGRGVPIYLIGEKILRHATRLEEAVEIIRQNRPGPLWTIVLSDLNRGLCWSVEASAKRFHLRKMVGHCFAQTNHVLATEKQRAEALETTPFALARNSNLRFEYLMKSLVSAGSPASLPEVQVAELLAHQVAPQGSPTNREDVLKLVTIQSAIFKASGRDTAPDNIECWISSDVAPTSSGRFVRFKLEDLLGKTGVDAPKPLEKAAFAEVLLSQVSIAKREGQLRAVELMKLWEQRDYQGVLERAIIASEAERLVCALAAYRLGDFARSLAFCKNAGVDEQHPEDFLALKIICRYRAAEPLSSLKDDAQELLSLTGVGARATGAPADPAMRRIAERILRNRALPRYLLNPNYDWFGGGICWRTGW